MSTQGIGVRARLREALPDPSEVSAEPLRLEALAPGVGAAVARLEPVADAPPSRLESRRWFAEEVDPRASALLSTLEVRTREFERLSTPPLAEPLRDALDAVRRMVATLEALDAMADDVARGRRTVPGRA